MEHEVHCLVPNETEQAKISSVIYDEIKQNRPADLPVLVEIGNALQARGAECLVLGRTELSLIKNQLPKALPVVDSLEVLAYQTILACQKEPIDFPSEFFQGGNA